MATIQTRAAQPALAIETAALVHTLVQGATDYIAYRKTIHALRRVDARALADIGVTPRNVKAAARKVVYGR